MKSARGICEITFYTWKAKEKKRDKRVSEVAGF